MTALAARRLPGGIVPAAVILDELVAEEIGDLPVLAELWRAHRVEERRRARTAAARAAEQRRLERLDRCIYRCPTCKQWRMVEALVTYGFAVPHVCERCPARAGRWRCRLLPGHDGPHFAGVVHRTTRPDEPRTWRTA